MQSQNSIFSTEEAKGMYLTHFEVVFCDPFGVNLCARTTREEFEDLKHEAQLSLSFLNENAVDAFEALFLTPVEFSKKFDNYIT